MSVLTSSDECVKFRCPHCDDAVVRVYRDTVDYLTKRNRAHPFHCRECDRTVWLSNGVMMKADPQRVTCHG